MLRKSQLPELIVEYMSDDSLHELLHAFACIGIRLKVEHVVWLDELISLFARNLALTLFLQFFAQLKFIASDYTGNDVFLPYLSDCLLNVLEWGSWSQIENYNYSVTTAYGYLGTCCVPQLYYTILVVNRTHVFCSLTSNAECLELLVFVFLAVWKLLQNLIFAN